MDYITALEEAMGMKAKKNMMPMQPGDVLETSAETQPLYELVNFKPQTTVKDGVKNSSIGIKVITKYRFINFKP